MLGEFLNIRLSPTELEKLKVRFGPQVTDDYIERLSCWLKNTRKRRSSHYACILTWIRKDRTIFVTSAGSMPTTLPLIEEAEQVSRAGALQRIRIREGLMPNDIDSCMRAIRELDKDRRRE